MITSSYIRRLGGGFVVLATAAAVMSASAMATPTATFKTRALPVPGVPGTGDFLGAGAVIEAEAKLYGTEYGGAPPPVVGVKYFAPAGTKVHPQGFATCAPSVLQERGPEACPKRSASGPKGFATGVVSFGGERVPETASLQEFFTPGGGMVAFIDGHTPALIEMIATAHVTSAPPPYGLEFAAEVPLIETVPGALDASAVEGTVEIGAGYEHAGKPISYITLPKTCPRGGWPEKAQASFLGGASVEVSTRMACPRR